MRYVMLVFALLGVAGSVFLGARWLGDLDKGRDKIAKMQELSDKMGEENFKKLSKAMGSEVDMNQYHKLVNASYALIGGAVLALLTSIVTFVRVVPGYIGGVILIACAVAPAIFEPKSLVFSGSLILAGLFAFFVRRPTPVVVRTVDRDYREDGDPFVANRI